MARILSWGSYCSLYPNEIIETDYNIIESEAEIKMNSFTHMQVYQFMADYTESSATDFQKQVKAQIESTLARLIHSMINHKKNGMGEGVSSVSNDGYSVTYDAKTSDAIYEEYKSIVQSGLIGTGLRGVV